MVLHHVWHARVSVMTLARSSWRSSGSTGRLLGRREPNLSDLGVEEREGGLDHGMPQDAITGLFPVHHRFVTGKRPAITGNRLTRSDP